MHDWWLKPMFMLLGIAIIVALLIVGLPAAFPSVTWSEINPKLVSFMPWIIVIGIGTLIYVMVVKK